MIFIKYILIFFVFLIFLAIGNLYSKRFTNRVVELEKMNNMLNIFKAKIKFSCSTIKEIFTQIYEDNHDNIGAIFKRANTYMEESNSKEAWEKAVDEAEITTNLKKEDITAIKTLGKMLGNTDVEGQVSQIELTQNVLQEQIKIAQEERKKNSKLYRTLGLASGLTVAIILM